MYLCMYVCMYLSIHLNLFICQFFRRTLTRLIFPSCHTKVEEPNLPYYLPIAERRITGFIPFPKVLALCENANSLSSRI